MFQFGPTWDIKDEERMEKLLEGAIPVLYNFEMILMPILFYYIYLVIAK